MADSIDSGAQVIDSREVIERIEELEGDLQSNYEDYETAYEEAEEAKQPVGPMPSFDQWVEMQLTGTTLVDEATEYLALKALAEQGEGYGDWASGEQLIREDYFTDCIEELIKDCYEMPKEMDSGNWPYRHMVMDYEAAAEEAKADYVSLDFAGQEFLMRA